MTTFGTTLKHWRAERRMSQLDLGLSANVSARHISFLETGRARPSRAMVLQLCEELAVPRPTRNQMLTAAGLAPAYAKRDLAEADMTPVRKAVDWLKARQRDDGGWGEGLESYEDWGAGHARAATPSQTAWALLGLMSAGEVDSDAVTRGVRWLDEAPREGARWEERHFTGTGFPKVFYLKYHGYAAFFPLWALARYQNLVASNDREVRWGI